jgi:hypothetical protein
MKQEPPPSKSKVDLTLAHLPVNDRVAALVMSFIKAKNHDAGDCIVALIGTIALISRGLSVANKFGCANALRDAADSIERAPQRAGI